MAESPRSLEDAWLVAMRQAWECVYVGIDHHSRQLTIAAATGGQFQAQQNAKNAAWIPTAVFAQDGLGYVELLEWLATKFPDVPRDRFVFLSEPTFAKPACQFLAAAGFDPVRILWVKTTEVGPYRKAKAISKSGKNDQDDARAMATMAFENATSAHERRHLFMAAPHAPMAEGLKHLAEDYARISRQLVSIQNRITDLVLRVFPECRRVWNKKDRATKPDGSIYEQRLINLFRSELPMKLLAAYPCPRAIAAAGLEELWSQFGGRGSRKKPFQQLIELASASGGLDNALDTKRLQLLIAEYQQLRQQQQDYKTTMTETLATDPVLVSLQEIKFLGPQAISTIVGALGDVSRFEDFDAVKRYLNIAPLPMPQTGDVDEQGRPIQLWRMPANTYKRANGQRQLIYETPGMKTVRKAAYLWFEIVVKCAAVAPSDPFVQLYQRLKETHRGRPHWLGKVRWKVIAKMIGVIYHCLRKNVSYDPSLVFGSTPALQATV